MTSIQRRIVINNSGANKSTSQSYASLFLIYWNDFLTVESFAQFMKVSERKAEKIINIGRECYNRRDYSPKFETK